MIGDEYWRWIITEDNYLISASDGKLINDSKIARIMYNDEDGIGYGIVEFQNGQYMQFDID